MVIMTDCLYALGAIILSPIWLTSMIATGKIRTDWKGRFGITPDLPARSDQARLLFHAVSVGEVNAIRKLVEVLSADFEIVIASTTNTGYRRAVELYGKKFSVIRYPFDFSWMVRRFLHRVNPDGVALVELELWPNFTRQCLRSGIPMVIVNGRLSARSYRGYRRIRLLVRGMFRAVSAVAAQDEAIAARFRDLGVKADRVQIIPSMKWDNAVIDDHIPEADELAESFGLDRSKPVVVAGSTAEDEEALLHDAVPSEVQLIVAPRKPEHFDQAANALPGCVRRSERKNHATPSNHTGTATRFLLDTIGELKAAYSLADVVVVGRSFGGLYGSDMIEPIALGKPTIIGPRTSDFHTIMQAFLRGEGILQVSREELAATIKRLLNDENERKRLAENGRKVILANQGAVKLQAELIREMIRTLIGKEKREEINAI